MPRYRSNRVHTASSTVARWNRRVLLMDDSDSDDSSSDSNSDVSSVSSNHSSDLGSLRNSDASDGENRQSNSDNSIVSADNSDDDGGQNVIVNNNSSSNSDNSNDSDSSLGSVHSRQSNNNSSRSGSSSHIDSDNNSSQSAQSFGSDSSFNRSEGSRPFHGPSRVSISPSLTPRSNSSDGFQNRLSPPPPLPPESDNSEDEDSHNSGAGSENNFFGLVDIFNTLRRQPSSSPNIFGSPLSYNSPSGSDNGSGDSETGQFANFLRGQVTQNMTGPRIVPSSSASTRASSVSYECSVCLENLDAPASIDEPATGSDARNNENDVQVHVDGRVGTPRGNTARTRGRGRGGRSSGPGSQRRPIHVVTPTDVVATHCGHMYHQVCLDKWFTEQGKRTCPSCRKLVPPSKLIRLYPNISVDSGVRNRNVSSADVNLPGPSGNNNMTATNLVPIAGTSTFSSSSVVRAPVIVDDEDNQNNGGDQQCTKLECQDLKVIHNTLINDFNDLQERYNDIRENEELKEAQIRSLEDDNTRQCNEIQLLKRQIEEVSAAPPPTANKRRRH